MRLRLRKDKANNKAVSSAIIDGSGAAADSGAAEGSTEPLQEPNDAPKCPRHTP
jgi:hypothetical protein